MHAVLRVAVFVAALSPAFAHPGIGIVRDSRGNLYYTDLKQVWKIAPDGTKSVAVPGVHTHELYVDAEDNLFGEHLWYEGDATGRWGHRVWRLGADGTLADVIPARVGFRDDYDDFHFVRDGRGAMYWADRGEETAIRKRMPGGPVTTIARAPFRDVRWMTATADGTVFLVDRHDLVRVDPDGEVRTVVENLARRRRVFLFVRDSHAIMGLWTDAVGNVYAAVSSDGEVKRIDRAGRVRVVHRASPGWSPTGGLVAPNGDLVILEYRGPLGARALRVERSGKRTAF